MALALGCGPPIVRDSQQTRWSLVEATAAALQAQYLSPSPCIPSRTARRKAVDGQLREGEQPRHLLLFSLDLLQDRTPLFLGPSEPPD